MKVRDVAVYNLKTDAQKVASKWRRSGEYKRVTIRKSKSYKSWRKKYGDKYGYTYTVTGWK